MTWPLLAALYATAAEIGSVAALLASACVFAIGRLAPPALLRPFVPVAFVVAASAIIDNEAWGVGIAVMVVLPVAASALTTLADHRLGTQTG